MRRQVAGRGEKRALVATLLLSAALSAGPVFAAEEPPTGPQLAVFVPDSSAATERFMLAEKLEKATEWSKAAEVYQELLDQYRDRVVPAGNKPEDAGLFVSVADRAIRQLAAWPPDGLAAYNGRFQPAADALLQQASSPSDIRAIVDRYGLTRAGQLAAGRLIQMHWDAGELASAARLAERIASLLPQDAPRKPITLLQAGMAWHLSGNNGRAKQLLETLKRDYPNAQATLGGQEASLAVALEKAIGTAAPTDTPLGSWPSYGGMPDRAAVPDFKGRSDALLFSIDTAAMSRFGDTGPISSAQMRMLLNQTLGIYPVYDQRQLFFHDGLNLHAVSIDGGMKLPGWQSTSVQLTAQAPTGPMLRTLALAPNAIYAVLADSTSPLLMGDGAGQDNSALICVDRQTGKIQWRITPSAIAQQNPVLKATQFASPPLVADDRIFVAARGGRNVQFHDVYVLCFNRTTGKLLWSSYVASGPNLNLMLMEEMPFPIESGLPQLSLHAGRVIISTNIGAIAAIETSDGTPAWLRTYPRIDLPAGRMIGRFVRPGNMNQPVARIFASSPAMIAGGNVFVLPVDGKSILVLDEVDGRILKQIPRASVDNADTLVGLLNDAMVIAGERKAMALDWRQALEEGDSQTDATRWAMDFPANALRGRPFLTADSLFLPTDDRLLRIATDKWKIEQTTPPYPATWDVTQGPGNVLVTEEHVVVASGKRVNVYTNLQSATARLDREVAASPGSVEPLVRYGELMFAAGQHPVALEKLRAGLKLATQAASQVEARDRLFSAALTCAVRLATQDTKSPHWRSFLQLARDAAQSPSQQVQYHFAAATMFLRDNDGSASLAQLQAILDDPQQRTVTYRDADRSTRSSAEIARRQINQLVDRYGTSVYQGVEQKAREVLAEAQGARDITSLLEMAQRYPNSTAAPLALYAAGQLQEARGSLAEASSIYRQLVQSYPSHPESVSFVEALARVYAAIPGKATIAASRLSQASAAFNNPSTRAPIRLPSGQVIQPAPFSEVADSLKAAAGIQHTQVLPNFALPSMGKAPFAESIDLNLAAERILPAQPGTTANYTHAVVLSPNGEISVMSNRGKVVARISEPKITAPTECVWLDETSLLVRNSQEMLGLNLSGKELWRVVPEQLPDVSEVNDDSGVQADEEQGDDAQVAIEAQLQGLPGVPDQIILQQARIRGGAIVNLVRPEPVSDGITEIRVAAGKVIFGTSSGRLAAVGAKDGKLLWQIRPNAGAIARISCSDDFTAAKVTGPGKSVLLCVDNDSGRLIHMRNLGQNLLQNILVTDDGQLVYTTHDITTQTGTIASKDLFDQGERVIFETNLQDTRQGNTSFIGQDRFDQLVLVDDVIVASTDRGSNVRLFSRYSGKQIAPGGEQSTSGAIVTLPQQNRASRSHLIAADPYVYAHNQQAIRAINVQRRETPDRRLPSEVMNMKAVLAGTRHLVAFEQPLRRGDSPTVPQVTFFAFSRAPGANGESGRLDHMLTIKQESGIGSYQLLEGGLCLVTGDKRLLYYPAAE